MFSFQALPTHFGKSGALTHTALLQRGGVEVQHSPCSQWKGGGVTTPTVLLPLNQGYKLSSLLNLLVPPAGGTGAPPAFARQETEGQLRTLTCQNHPAEELERCLQVPGLRGVEWKIMSLLSSADTMLGGKDAVFRVWLELDGYCQQRFQC